MFRQDDPGGLRNLGEVGRVFGVQAEAVPLGAPAGRDL